MRTDAPARASDQAMLIGMSSRSSSCRRRLSGRATRLEGSTLRCGGASFEDSVIRVADHRRGIMSEEILEIRIAGYPCQQRVDVFAFMAPCSLWICT